MMRAIFKLLLSLLIAGGLLLIVFRYVPIAEVISALSQTRTEWVVAGLICLVIERVAAAVRMKMLTDRLGLELSTLKVLEITTIASFYGLFAPGELGGGAVRWYRMSRPTGGRAQAFAAIVVERMADTIILVIVGLVFWFVDASPFHTGFVDITLLIALALLIVALVTSFSAHTSAVLAWVARWIPWKRLREKLVEMADKVLVSIRTLRDLGVLQLNVFLFCSLVRVLVAVVMLMCFAIGLGMSVRIETIGWIRSFLNIITLLPVSFSGLGVREGSLVLLLAPYGVPAALAVAFSLMHFFVYVVVATAGALWELKNVLFSGTTTADSVPPVARRDTEGR